MYVKRMRECTRPPKQCDTAPSSARTRLNECMPQKRQCGNRSHVTIPQFTYSRSRQDQRVSARGKGKGKRKTARKGKRDKDLGKTKTQSSPCSVSRPRLDKTQLKAQNTKCKQDNTPFIRPPKKRQKRNPDTNNQTNTLSLATISVIPR